MKTRYRLTRFLPFANQKKLNHDLNYLTFTEYHSFPKLIEATMEVSATPIIELNSKVIHIAQSKPIYLSHVGDNTKVALLKASSREIVFPTNKNPTCCKWVPYHYQ